MQKRTKKFLKIIAIVFIFLLILSFINEAFKNTQVNKYISSCVKGNSESCYNLGYKYYQEKEYTAAYRWFKKSANLGNINAFSAIGNLYENGLGFDKDYLLAANWYRQGIIKGSKGKPGYAEALYNLAVIYDNGFGVKRDINKALDLMQKSADAGNTKAKELLDKYNIKTKNIANNSIENILKSAQNGDLESQYALFQLYFVGNKSIKQNIPEAIKWLKSAANKGSAKAQYKLGQLYEVGQHVDKNFEEAVKFYSLAADQGLVEAQYSLGFMYNKGRGVEKNLEKAYKLYKKSADQGFALGKYSIGLMYFNGEYLKKDTEKAKQLLEEVIVKDNLANAQLYLGFMYLEGNGVKKDASKGLEYINAAIAQNNLEAKFYLAQLYENGKFIKQDYTKARILYQEVANKNIDIALIALANIYEKGLGVKADKAKALELYQKAADIGSENAKKKVLELTK